VGDGAPSARLDERWLSEAELERLASRDDA
jgi:hypothetical protein